MPQLSLNKDVSGITALCVDFVECELLTMISVQLEKLNKFRPAHARNEEFPDFVYRPTDNPAFVLVILEYVCIGWFTFEYFIR